jgi:hypothetical protein
MGRQEASAKIHASKRGMIGGERGVFFLFVCFIIPYDK